MRLYLGLIICLLLSPPVAAQIVLQKSADLPDHYIVEFKSAVDAAARLREQGSAAIEDLRRRQAERVARLQADLRDSNLALRRSLWLKQSVAISVDARYLERIRALPYVATVRIERQFRARPQGVVTLPISGELVQDNLERIDVDSMWNAQYRGQGVVVAILDSGVDLMHEDLVDRWRGGTNSWYDPYQQQPQPKDLSGHGTAVGSVVLGGNAGGSYIGVAPYAQWIAARIFDNNGDSSESAISDALQWVLDPDGNPATDDYPDIVQNSWGLDATEGQCFNPFSAELAAIDALGIDQVFAVGNSGLSGPGNGGFSSYLTPAFDSHVISVGALRSTDVLLFSSSRGPDICGSAIIPSLVAPGEFIRTADLTFGGFDTDNMTVSDGTSFSSPHVSGMLALLRSQFEASAHLQYRDAIYDSTVDLGGSQDDYGRGLPQATAAATLLLDQVTPLRAHEVSFSNAVYAFTEGEAGTRVAVIRSGDISGSASVDIQSADGSATSGNDYQAILETLNFTAGESVKLVDIVTNDNLNIDKNRNFTLTLSLNVGVNLGAKPTTSITIRDDDGAATEEDTIGGTSSGILELLFFAGLLVGRWVRR